MKKLLSGQIKFEKSELLQRNHLNSIFGGYLDVATCSADCLDGNGNTYTVKCEGNNCTSSDYNGCSSDKETKSC